MEKPTPISFQNGVQLVKDEIEMRDYVKTLKDEDNADISKKELLSLLDRINELRKLPMVWHDIDAMPTEKGLYALATGEKIGNQLFDLDSVLGMEGRFHITHWALITPPEREGE